MMSSSAETADPSQSLQERTLLAWVLLSSLRPDWGGALILACGLGPVGSAVALAANIAGAACLAIEPDAAVSRAAMRAGVCDFFVNTVDEAVRGLKNEVRQHRPLSVALELDTTAALVELSARGVLPQLFTAEAAASPKVVLEMAHHFEQQGSILADFDGALKTVPNALQASCAIKTFIQKKNLEVHSFCFDNSRLLNDFDKRLKVLVEVSDSRRAWIIAAPRLFHRERPCRRAVPLTAGEFALLHPLGC